MSSCTKNCCTVKALKDSKEVQPELYVALYHSVRTQLEEVRKVYHFFAPSDIEEPSVLHLNRLQDRLMKLSPRDNRSRETRRLDPGPSSEKEKIWLLLPLSRDLNTLRYSDDILKWAKIAKMSKGCIPKVSAHEEPEWLSRSSLQRWRIDRSRFGSVS